MNPLVRERLYEYKKIKSRGALLHLIRIKGEKHWKFHNWGGPAILPQRKDSEFLTKEYHLHGIQYSEEDYLEILREREGLPFYKQAAFKGTRT